MVLVVRGSRGWVMGGLFRLALPVLAVCVLLFGGFPAAAQEDIPDAAPGLQYERLPDYIPSAVQRIAGADRLDAHVVDSRSLAWRTGSIDPAAEKLPVDLARALESDPKGALPALVDWLGKGATNDYHFVKRVHDWIGLNVAYDYDAFMGRARGSQEPADVVRNRRTTCGGFARLFALLCQQGGVECRYVSGISRAWLDAFGDPGQVGMSGHAWNAVRIQGAWYIVEGTGDNRRSYEFGRFGELKPYRDGGLFMSPAAKLLANAASNMEDQLVDKPLRAWDFLAQPQVTDILLKEGLIIDSTGLGGELVKVARRVSGSDKAQVSDGWYPDTGRGSIVVEHPAEVSLRIFIKNVESGKTWPSATGVVPLEGGGGNTVGRVRSELRIAVPGPGTWECFVQATRPSGADPVFRQVWRFLILLPDSTPDMEADVRRGLALDEGVLVPQHRASHKGMDGGTRTVRPLWLAPADPAWYVCEIPLAPGTEYFAALYDEAGQSIQGAVTASRQSPVLMRYYIRRPADRPGLLNVYGKITGEASFNHRVYSGLIPPLDRGYKVALDGDGKALGSPVGELVLRQSWFDAGLGVPESLVWRPDGTAEVSFAAGADQRCRPFLRTPDKKDVPGHAFLVQDAGGKSRMILAPVPGALSTAYLFYYGDNGSNAVCSLILPPAPALPSGQHAGPETLLPSGVIQPLHEPMAGFCSVRLDSADGGADCALVVQSAPGYESSVSTYHRNGSPASGDDLKGMVQISYPSADKRVYYYRDVPLAGYWIQVFTRKIGDKDYRPVYVMGRWGPGKALPDGEPITFSPVFSKRFGQDGLLVEGWTRESGRVRLSVRGPASLELVCLIQTRDGKKGAGTCNFRHDGGLWYFDFVFPPDSAGRLTGKIHMRNEKGSLENLVNFPLGGEN